MKNWAAEGGAQGTASGLGAHRRAAGLGFLRLQSSPRTSIRVTTQLRELIGLKQARILSFRFTEAGLVVGVKPAKRTSFSSGCGGRARRSTGEGANGGISTSAFSQSRSSTRRGASSTRDAACRRRWCRGRRHAPASPTRSRRKHLAQRTDKTTMSTMMAIARKRTITKRCYGFHGPWSLSALIFLCCSGLVHRHEVLVLLVPLS